MNGEFIGIFFNTWKGIFFVTAEKAASDSLVREASEILERNMTSRQIASSFKGKLRWYSCSLDHVALMTREINKWIGSPENP
eukprot:732275-Rhodomonas_salina.1